jgi:polyisoprenoid-binding protein YceI
MAAPARAQPAPGVYSVGRAGSTVSFTLHGKALFSFKREGRFNEFAGELAYRPERPADTHVDLTVYTNSVDMHDRDGDRLLKSNDFFDVEHFPTMHFAGSIADDRNDGKLAIVGDLTIRGITKRISAPVAVRSTGTEPPVFETSFQIDRTEFGLNGVPKWRGFDVSVARNVDIHIAIAPLDSRSSPVR